MSREMTKEQWLAIRKEAALQIEPETAEVSWLYGPSRDPYGLTPYKFDDVCEDNVGRNYFARSPGSDVWVSFDDLPDAVGDALWNKVTRAPAG